MANITIKKEYNNKASIATEQNTKKGTTKTTNKQ